MSFRGLAPGAQKALTIRAQLIAHAHGARLLQPSHLLQVILDYHPEESDIACGVLHQTRDDLIRLGSALLHTEKGLRARGDVPPSREAKRVIEDSARIARDHHQDYIGLGHLFCAYAQFLSERLDLGWFAGDTQGRDPSAAIIAAFGDTFDDALSDAGETGKAPEQNQRTAALSSDIAAALLRILDDIRKPTADLDTPERAQLYADMQLTIDRILSDAHGQ